MRKDFKLSKKEVTLWTDHYVPPSPHQEYIPYMNVLRPLSTTHWHLTDGDDEYRI